MNAPTGRKRSVSVSERAIAASDLPNSFPIAVSVITTRKKSNASSIQPRNPAATVAFRSLAAGRGAVMGASRLQPSTHACDPGHDRHPTVFPCSPLLLRAKPSKGGDAEPRGYGGGDCLARRAASAVHVLAAFFVRGDRR